MAHREISKDTDLTDKCPDCGMEYAGPGHVCGGAQLPAYMMCMWCGCEIIRDDTGEILAAITNHLLDCKDHPLSRRIEELLEQLKIKNKALEEIRVNVRLDTTSVQWIEQRAEQALKGE